MINKIRRKTFIPLERVNFNVAHYKPKANKVKQGVLMGFVGLCLVTPCTNFLIPIAFKGISKLSPLWMYK